ncbi:MAG: di-trans,poly-cis-decaprenylcistransferase, partial [Bacteroidales bacterium]|nr:di-trans,poly-cis-decaprenylcistransferase [Bacteroidales bacterium]
MTYRDKIDIDKLPVHIAVIMDGNGRWAKEKGNQRIFGHKNGVSAVRETVEAAAELGIQYLTLYAFSTENWNRPKLEVDALMSLLVSSLHEETPTLLKNNIQLISIGNIGGLSEEVSLQLKNAKEKTAHNSGLKLVLALNYSGRWEILDAVNRMKSDMLSGKLDMPITEHIFSTYLATYGIPDPELMIRTSGESRISNFLLWQIAYSE